MRELLQWADNNITLVIVGTVTLIQIAPIKIDPWTSLLKFISKALLKETNDKVDSLALEIKKVQDSGNTRYINSMRWEILTFSNSCRRDIKHTREEWEHIIQLLKDYEIFISENDITNGVIEQETEYLRELYQNRLYANDFLAG